MYRWRSGIQDSSDFLPALVKIATVPWSGFRSELNLLECWGHFGERSNIAPNNRPSPVSLYVKNQ